MITVADLRSQTVKDLSAMARKMGLTGVHSMRKDQLVKALLKATKAKQAAASSASRRSSAKKRAATSSTRARTASSKAVSTKAASSRATSSRATSSRETSSTAVSTKTTRGAKAKSRSKATPKTSERVVRKIHKLHAKRQGQRDLSHASVVAANNGRRKKKALTPKPTPVPGKDRIVLLVRDPYWLQACWDVTRQSVARAKAALAEHWHTCTPTLRLLQVEAGATTSTSERVVREITVHGGVKNWYIDIQDSPNSYRVELGYLAENGRFFGLSRSNVVTTPRPGSIDAIDENWADIAENYERVYAMSGGYEPSSAGGDLQELFEEQLRRPMGAPLTSRLASDSPQPAIRRDKDFDFEVDAEMIIYGATKPGSHVTLSGEPVRLRPDGSFTVRLTMPDRRQLLPVVASSRDGAEQRTIVLAVERNTKVMEPMTREAHS